MLVVSGATAFYLISKATVVDSVKKECIDFQVLKTALDAYYLDWRRYPTKDEGLDFLSVSIAPEAKLRYLDEIPLDGWGRPYIYVPQTDDSDVKIYSTGENGVNEHCEGDDFCAAQCSKATDGNIEQ